MKASRHKTVYALTLFLGDFCVWFFALWLGLFLRRLHFPSFDFYFEHAVPYLFVFIFWFLVAYGFGMYESKFIAIKSKYASILVQSQFYSTAIAVILFYLIPAFSIKPKLTLFLVLFVTLVSMILWRIFGVRLFKIKKREKCLYITARKDSRDLFDLVNNTSYYHLYISNYIDISTVKPENIISWVEGIIKSSDVRIIILDPRDEKIKDLLPKLYSYSFEGIVFINESEIYEDLAEKIQVQRLNYEWLIENISFQSHLGYDLLKRIMDILVAIPLFILSIPIYIPVMILVGLDGGPVFFFQERVGKNNKNIYIAKIRTMNVMDSGKPLVDNDPRITKIGKYLRKTRIDELPQLVNVIFGDLSLIGPRPEVPKLVEKYNEEIMFYNVRHFIKPGLSGWAQVNHTKPPQTVEETIDKLAYDLYYTKNRSLIFDFKIALKTLYTLVSKTGV